MSPAQPEDNMVDQMLFNYAATLQWIQEAAASIPANRFAEPLPTAPNHPAWLIGHLAGSAAFLGSLLNEPFGDAFAEEKPVYGVGSNPAAGGPFAAKDVLLARLAERHALLAAAVKAKHREYFPTQPPERLRAVAPTIGYLALYLLASHEHYHLAQLRQWKLAAGIA